MVDHGDAPNPLLSMSLVLYTVHVYTEISESSPKRQILDSSKLKEVVDNNFKSDKNDRKFSERVENNAGKGEIARYEQFPLFQQCF